MTEQNVSGLKTLLSQIRSVFGKIGVPEACEASAGTWKEGKSMKRASAGEASRYFPERAPPGEADAKGGSGGGRGCRKRTQHVLRCI